MSVMMMMMMSGNSLGQTVHTHCASVHQAAKLVAAIIRVAGVTAGLAESNGSRVYGSRHLQADCQELGSAPDPSLGNRVRVSDGVLVWLSLSSEVQIVCRWSI